MARRAPKLTVTREGDTLCQKVCYPLAACFFSFRLVSLLLVEGFDCEIKRSRGAGCEPPARAPLRANTEGQGGVWGGELFTIFSGARLAFGSDVFQAAIDFTFQGERI
jgi:hypothetical protein